MTNEVLIWILTGIFISIASGVATFFAVQSQMGSLRERIVALEVTIELMGRKSAKTLHSPHDPYGLDEMLDKYLDRHYEMSFDEWQSLLKRCDALLDRKDLPKEERILAATLAAVCWHKLRMPPPRRKAVQVAAADVDDADRTNTIHP